MIERLKNYLKGYWWILALIVFIVSAIFFTVYISNHIAEKNANKLADSLRNEWQMQNQSLYDNIAVLKFQVQTLDANYKKTRRLIDEKYKQEVQAYDNVKASKDKQAMASFFDNVIDGYQPISK